MTGIAPSYELDTGHAPAAPTLEAQLGDPFHDGAVTFETIVANEDASRLTPAVRSLCDALGVGAELVPAVLGGRRTSATRLVSQLRPLFRRDVSLAVDLAVAPLSVMNAALAAGDARQRSDLAGRISAGERVGAVLADPDAYAPARGVRVRAINDGWLADGESPLVASADAALWALPVRVAAGEALVLCDTADGGVDVAPWVETVGLRGTRFGIATVRSVLPTGDVLISDDGSRAVERARAETAAIVAALMIGAVDTAVHLALPYAVGRRLYRGTVLDIPHARSLLADVHTDLLIADALATKVVAELDAGRFDETAAAASAYLVPQLLGDAMRALSVLFGSTFYARVEPYEIFETFVRDVGSLSLLGIGTVRSLGSLTREAALGIAVDACVGLRGTGAGPASDEWLAAAHVRLGTRLTGRKASLPEASIESAVDDLTSCVESSLSLTLERVPIFGR
ncbi:MAG: acyl-CoA dehydrogenase family protein [Microbacterium sp.]